jgi:predicted nucleotidyltransferase
VKIESTNAVFRALNEASVRFIVVGGVAVVAHGYGRATFDLDLVINLEPGTVARAFDALESLDYHPAVPITATQFGHAQTRDSFRHEKGMIVLKFWSDRHRETPLDVFVTEPFNFDDEYREAKIDRIADDLDVRILRIETLLEMKRAAARPQDLADVSELEFLHRGTYDDHGTT